MQEVLVLEVELAVSLVELPTGKQQEVQWDMEEWVEVKQPTEVTTGKPVDGLKKRNPIPN